ncbi:MAG: alpha/beta hydrolase [Pseudomonadales bacterium]|nr:alpha/beta hydrolase [Pseudomonadales bacterium]
MTKTHRLAATLCLFALRILGETAILALASTVFTGCSSLSGAPIVDTPLATHSYILAGQGSPTVVFEAGLGDGKETWGPVYQQVSGFAQAFAYDRAGYGHSRSSNTSRDGATIVRELGSTLGALQLKPPFVLVGHSIGGTYLELFARTYPQDVAGVVLVDARHSDFTRRCLDAHAPGCRPPAALMMLMPGPVKREFAGAADTESAIRRAGEFPDVPLAVLSSGRTAPLTGAGFHKVWLASQADLAQLSSRSTHEVCASCGHYVHRDDPERVVAAIRAVVAEARALRSAQTEPVSPELIELPDAFLER